MITKFKPPVVTTRDSVRSNMVRVLQIANNVVSRNTKEVFAYSVQQKLSVPVGDYSTIHTLVKTLKLI